MIGIILWLMDKTGWSEKAVKLGLKIGGSVLFVVLVGVGLAYTYHKIKETGVKECKSEIIIQRVEVQNEAKAIRHKVRVAAARGVIPDRVRKFYVD